MVAYIIDTYGRGAMAKVAAAYRDGATDGEALRAGTGIPTDQLYADYFRSFGASEPQPVAAASIGPSVVDTGTARSSNGAAASATPLPPGEVAGAEATASTTLAWVAIAALVITSLAVGFVWYRRRGTGPAPPGGTASSDDA